MSALGWLLGDDIPALSTVSPRPWPDLPDDFPGRVALLLRPLVRALLLAGYRVHRLDFVRSDTADDNALTLTLNGLTPGTSTQLDPMTPSTGAGVVLAVAELVHERAVAVAAVGGWLDPMGADPATDLRRAFSHALAVPASQEAPWVGLVPGDTGEVVLWSGAAPASVEEPGKLSIAWTGEIGGGALAISADVQDALARRVQAGNLTPLAGAGLLWLLNPLFWYAHDVTFPGTAFRPDVVGAAVPPLPWPGVVSATAQGLDPASVRAVQPPPDPDLSQFVNVTGNLVATLNEQTHVLLGPLIQHPDRRGGELATLLAPRRGVVAAQEARWVGNFIGARAGKDLADRMRLGRANWLEMVLDLTERAMLTPAGYPVPLASSLADDVDPVLVRWHPAASGLPERVVLQVRGVDAVTISSTPFLEIDLFDGFAWDYLAAERPGDLLTLVVVAGPGVAVTPASDRGLGWDLEVIRVWNYDGVPLRVSRIQTERLLCP